MASPMLKTLCPVSASKLPCRIRKSINEVSYVSAQLSLEAIFCSETSRSIEFPQDLKVKLKKDILRMMMLLLPLAETSAAMIPIPGDGAVCPLMVISEERDTADARTI